MPAKTLDSKAHNGPRATRGTFRPLAMPESGSHRCENKLTQAAPDRVGSSPTDS